MCVTWTALHDSSQHKMSWKHDAMALRSVHVLASIHVHACEGEVSDLLCGFGESVHSIFVYGTNWVHT